MIESLSRAKDQIPAIRLTKVEFTGDGDRDTVYPGRKHQNESRLAHLGGVGVT